MKSFLLTVLCVQRGSKVVDWGSFAGGLRNLWKQNHSCTGIPVRLQLPLPSSVCIESFEQRILWLEKSILFRKIPIFRISGPSECLWVGTFRACKIHIRPDKNVRDVSQNYIHGKHKWNHLSFKLLTCSEARIQWPRENYMHFLDVYQCLMFSSNPSCQCLELQPL